MFEKLKQAFGGLKEKITLKMLSEKDLSKPLQALRNILIQNDVSVLAAEKICELLEQELLGEKVGRFENIKNLLHDSLKKVITEILTAKAQIDIIDLVKNKKEEGEPAKFLFVSCRPAVSISTTLIFRARAWSMAS